MKLPSLPSDILAFTPWVNNEKKKLFSPQDPPPPTQQFWFTSPHKDEAIPTKSAFADYENLGF